MAAMTATCEPVFTTARAIPSFDRLPDTFDLCVAAENVSGKGTIRGAQRIRGLWRIYPHNKNARNELLVKGMIMNGTRVELFDKNPFIISDQTEKPATKVWVGNVPLSCSNKVIEESLKKIGCELRSTVRSELARDRDGKLTTWETGRRFVFITTPSSPLQPTLKIGIFNAIIYHKEQKSTKSCSNCLSKDGHSTAECPNEVVCHTCKKPGHRKGDCPITEQEEESLPSHTATVQTQSSLLTTTSTESATVENLSKPLEEIHRKKNQFRSRTSSSKRARSESTSSRDRSTKRERQSRVDKFIEKTTREIQSEPRNVELVQSKTPATQTRESKDSPIRKET